MKRCPYCAEEIQDEALKCLHCGSWVEEPPHPRHFGGGPPGSKRLMRSRSDRMIAGICGGLGDYLGVDSTIVRVAYVMVSVLSVFFPGILVYILMIIIVPLEPEG